MIAKCICKHDYQDKKYGLQNRVMNRAPTNNEPDRVRCTVCGKERNAK